MTAAPVPEVARIRRRPFTARARSALGRSLTGFPFESRRDRRLLVHCAHHKVGTVWFKNVLGRVAALHGLPFHMSRLQPVVPQVGVMVVNGSRIDLGSLPPFRGSHIVRDPREVAVPGYFYHRRCNEPWVLEPDERYGGRSYQQYLQSADEETGLAEEIVRHTSRVCATMSRWDYERPEFLELRYEQFLADEAAHWYRLFRHYGFREKPAARAARLACNFSTSSEAYRQRRSAHVRSGKPGDWRSHFTARHRDVFPEHCGDTLVRLGYERDDSW